LEDPNDIPTKTQLLMHVRLIHYQQSLEKHIHYWSSEAAVHSVNLLFMHNWQVTS